MSKSQRLNSILDQAKGKELKYDWLEAAKLYGQALHTAGKRDFLKKVEIHEKIGYCFYRAAFQAETREESKKHMRLSIEACEEAAKLCERLGDPKKQARKNFCLGMASYHKSWLVEDPSERKALLDKCRKLLRRTLKAYDEAGDKLSLAKTCAELANYFADRLDLELDTRMREKILDEALSLGEMAMQIFSDVRDKHELARAYCISGINCYNATMSLQLETKRKECEQKTFDYAKKAIRISEETSDKLLLSRSTVLLGNAELDLGSGWEAASELFKKALQDGLETKDHRVISEAFDGLAYSTYWSMLIEEDLEKMRERSKRCEEYAGEAIGRSILANYGRGIPHSYGFGYVANFRELAGRAIELEARHKLMKKAVDLGRQGQEHARRTGSTHAIFHVSHELSQALYYVSTMKTDVDKTPLLEESMTLGDKAVYYNEQLRPHFMWSQAYANEALALTLFELGKLEKSREKRRELLEKCVSRMETSLAFFQRHVTFARAPSRRVFFALLGRLHTELGNILNQLYETTSEKEVLEKLIDTYKNAVQMNKNAGLTGRIAEAYWQIAVAYDRLGEYLESANNFVSASGQYRLSAQSIPQHNGFYMGYSAYMQAWNEIERARYHHAEKHYKQAKEHYENAASLHASTERWKYLNPNYLAWARLEKAEELSRGEQTKEAKDCFQQAAKLFVEAKKAIKAQLERIEVRDEKDLAIELAKASGAREEYCLGRIALEEAKILDRQGNHAASSARYGSAAERFQKSTDATEHESDRKELRPIVYLCRAWQKMTQAEAEASPDLYLEASKLFGEAKEHSTDEKAKLLALGHSSFCKALEAGTRFEDVEDKEMYSTAKNHLEVATKYYLKAGFQNASEYARATHRLFDAYLYMHKAETATDPMKKAQYYRMAEKLFQTSAGSYVKAKHPEKSEEVQRLLANVKAERQLAMSLAEVLHAPTITSTTTSFSTPTSTHEQAVGLEKFEHADIQANLILRLREVKVGEDVEFRVELVNAGKAPALLIKVEEIIPEGFEIGKMPEIYTVEDSYIDMKGKKLNPLKTEDVRLVVKPRSKGTFIVKPRILYIDETGKYKSHEPEPVTITVKELGIKGWIKGER